MPSLDEQLLDLRACIKDKPPYYSGTLHLPLYDFLLYYGKDDEDVRSVACHIRGKGTNCDSYTGASTSTRRQGTA